MIPCMPRSFSPDRRDMAEMCAIAGITSKSMASGQHTEPRELVAKLSLADNMATGLARECLAHYKTDPGKRSRPVTFAPLRKHRILNQCGLDSLMNTELETVVLSFQPLCRDELRSCSSS